MNCRDCGRPVLRIRDTDTGLDVNLEPDQIPITRELAQDLLVFEHLPSGWHCQSVNRRRGHPVHLQHTHTTQGEVTS